MPGNVKVDGAWKTVSSASVKVDGAWKALSNAWVKVAGVWVSWLDSIRQLVWSQNTMASLSFLTANYFAAGTTFKYFAFGTNLGSPTSIYLRSTNGVTWTTAGLPASSTITASASSSSRILVFDGNNGFTFQTLNGTTWTSTTRNEVVVRDAIFDGTYFLAVSTDTASNGLRFSTNGGTFFTGIDVGNGGNSIAFDGISRYVVMSATSTATHRTNTSSPIVAGNWSNITLPSTGTWACVVYGNGIWFAARAGSTAAARSTNGTTWTAVTLPSNFSESTTDVYAKALFINDAFYYYYTDFLYFSTNGSTWTTAASFASSTLDQLNGWAVGPTAIIGVGNPSTTTNTGIYLRG
jgi:hypothetical protein